MPDSAGVYFVPALTGLFAPRWREDARAYDFLMPAGAVDVALGLTTAFNVFVCVQPRAGSVLVGLTQYADRRHVIRATLDGICLQTKEVGVLAAAVCARVVPWA